MSNFPRPLRATTDTVSHISRGQTASRFFMPKTMGKCCVGAYVSLRGKRRSIWRSAGRSRSAIATPADRSARRKKGSLVVAVDFRGVSLEFGPSFVNRWRWSGRAVSGVA